LSVKGACDAARLIRSTFEDQSWIAQQFAQAHLGDARRTRRAEQLALNMLQAPDKGLPTQTQTWAGLKAAYRLLHCEDVTRQKLMQPHFKQTQHDALAHPVTLFVQDTTDLSFTQLEHAQGFGPVGDRRGSGLHVHTLLTLTPTGEVLGLAAQHCWARPIAPAFRQTESRAQRQVRKGKESEVWHKVLADVGPVPTGQRWISIGDRGSDSFDYWRRATATGWHCLSRIFTNRRTADNSYLLLKARELPAQGQMVVHQRARPGQAARTLHLDLAWSRVQVLAPGSNPSLAKLPALDVSVVRCWDDKHKVEWVLLATWPVDNFDDAAQCVNWYTQRWSIEEFHKCLKSGCRLESSQLKQARAVDVLLGFCSLVAVRLLALARLARIHPQEPASEFVDHDNLAVLCAMRNLEPKTLTVRSYWREVARIGGFLARTHDGDPGWKTLWQGLTKLEQWVIAWKNGYEKGRRSG